MPSKEHDEAWPQDAAQTRQGDCINRRQRRCHDVWVPGTTIGEPHDLAEELGPGPDAQRPRDLGELQQIESRGTIAGSGGRT